MKLPLLPLNRFGYFTSFLAPQEVLNVSSWWFSIRSHEAYLALNFWSHQHDVVAWKSLRDKQSPIIAFVQNPFWILEGPNVILMMAPLSNIAFTFSPFRAALSWAGRKIKHRGSAISLSVSSLEANHSSPFAPLSVVTFWEHRRLVQRSSSVRPATCTCSI